jgi:hypothetical protein
MLFFWEDEKAFTHFANKLCSPLHTNLNLGGGPGFVEWGWTNLDGARGPYNLKPFAFSKNIRLPFMSRRFRRVYTSHFLEHLREDVARRTLLETYRVMRKGAELIVKIPDYDETIAAWSQQNSDFFSDDRWNFGAFTPTWAKHGIKDNLTNRALMIFCGYWTREYGDPFAGDIRDHELAFHGPPNVSQSKAISLLESRKPLEIARVLHAQVLAEDPEAQFNHQTAWSRDEFSKLLNDCGFAMIDTDKTTICERHAGIPGLLQMFDVSAYYWAKK